VLSSETPVLGRGTTEIPEKQKFIVSAPNCMHRLRIHTVVGMLLSRFVTVNLGIQLITDRIGRYDDTNLLQQQIPLSSPESDAAASFAGVLLVQPYCIIS
jgi:hypothetical protein